MKKRKETQFGIYSTFGVGTINLAEFQETLDSKMAGTRAVEVRRPLKMRYN